LVADRPFALADGLDGLATRFVDREVEDAEHVGGGSLFLSEQPQQQVLGVQGGVLQASRLLLGQDDDLPRTIREPVVRDSLQCRDVGNSWVWRLPNRLAARRRRGSAQLGRWHE